MKVKCLEIVGGRDRSGSPESVTGLILRAGESLAVVGPTGSGKSELLADIEQLACDDTPSGRRIMLNGDPSERSAAGLVATLSQRTNFVMDTDVETFVAMHLSCLGKEVDNRIRQVMNLANSLCGERIVPDALLQGLSGGQTRALMIADIALVSDAPVVLIDEVENAGIDKHRALAVLAGHGKIVVIATHDPVLMLMNSRRVVMGGGGMRRVIAVDEGEKCCLARLQRCDTALSRAREALRKGYHLSREFSL